MYCLWESAYKRYFVAYWKITKLQNYQMCDIQKSVINISVCSNDIVKQKKILKRDPVFMKRLEI